MNILIIRETPGIPLRASYFSWVFIIPITAFLCSLFIIKKEFTDKPRLKKMIGSFMFFLILAYLNHWLHNAIWASI
jgi:uncharacterized membrane protein